MINQIILVAIDENLYAAWSEAFALIDNVTVATGDLFDFKADAIVSPANSFGIMDGGLDLYIRDVLGVDTEQRLQKEILKVYYGEMPVGNALIVPTHRTGWPYLIAAPTMRVPENVAQSINAYLAFRAVLLAVKHFNESATAKISSIVCPGLATGTGYMSARKCAAQMRVAYQYLSNPEKIPSFNEIHEVHRKLHRAG